MLGYLCQLLQAAPLEQSEALDCLLKLVGWVNRDTGAFRLHESKEEEDAFTVDQPDIVGYEALCAAALDLGHLTATKLLLQINEGLFRAARTRRLEQRYDLLGALLSRLQSATEPARLNHLLGVLAQYLTRTAEFNASPAHGFRTRSADAVTLTVTPLNIEGAEMKPRAVVCHAHAPLAEVVALAAAQCAIPALAPQTSLALKALRKSPLYGKHLRGPLRTVAEFGIKDGDKFLLVLEQTPAALPAGGVESPADAVGLDDGFRSVLLALVAYPPTFAAAWAVLQMAPTGRAVAAAAAAPGAWAALLAAERPLWERVYACQVAEALLLPAVPATQPPAFDGLPAVLQLLESLDLDGMDPHTRACSLGPMLRVVQASFFAGGGADAARVMEALFRVVRIGSLAALTEGEVGAVSFALSTVTAIVKRSAGEWAKVATKFPVATLAKLLLDSPDARLRREAAATFCELMGGGAYTLPGPQGALVPAAAATAQLFLDPSPFLALPVGVATAGDFFAVCGQLLVVGGAWLDPPALAALFAAKLAQVVAPALDLDAVLAGTLTCLALLLELHPGCVGDPAPLLDAIFARHLMQLPWAASREAVGRVKPLVDVSGPLCTSPAARAAACRLLAALSAAPDLRARVGRHLAQFAERTCPPDRHAATDELKQSVRPGLVNTANRCYMNSLCLCARHALCMTGVLELDLT